MKGGNLEMGLFKDKKVLTYEDWKKTKEEAQQRIEDGYRVIEMNEGIIELAEMKLKNLKPKVK